MDVWHDAVSQFPFHTQLWVHVCVCAVIISILHVLLCHKASSDSLFLYFCLSDHQQNTLLSALHQISHKTRCSFVVSE